MVLCEAQKCSNNPVLGTLFTKTIQIPARQVEVL